MQPIATALLGRWYALVREKRATRQEFLRAVLKVFELRDVTNASLTDFRTGHTYIGEQLAADHRGLLDPRARAPRAIRPTLGILATQGSDMLRLKDRE